ncbi:MAG: pilus assembly protein N-terminal domain-containing protein [Selenomonadaceae bacterium]|nr:pilus assembly protein N-terminal domain-containing protein [Selenomonadaceae bacterium]
MQFRKLKGLLLAASLLVLPPSTTQAAEMLEINLNASHYLKIDKPITRVATGSADIISIVELKPSRTEILIVAKQPGSTSMLIWTADGNMTEYLVNVSPEDKGQANMIERAINLPHVKVQKVGNRVMLSGKVRNQYEREYAIKTVQLYTGSSSVHSITNSHNVGARRNTNMGEQVGTSVSVFENATGGESGIIDLLEIEFPTQVKLEAQIIEISVDDAKSLGVQWYGSTDDGKGEDAIGSAGVFYGGQNWNPDREHGYRDFKNNPFRWFYTNQAPINFTLSALISKGKARILSRPNITTMSGEAASIHIGGEIPVPISDDGDITYEYHPYGVILKIVPTVDNKNKITSDVTAIISTLDYANSISINGTSVPGFRTREANAVINVETGMTMAIGGLIDSTESKNVVKVPILGSIPILGEFFKHTQKSKDKRELMILITPTIVTDEGSTPMTTPMRDWYEEGQRFAKDREQVDLNEPYATEPFTKEPTKR